MPSVYVDGQTGTTGLRIHQLLANRSDLRLLRIEPERRRDMQRRLELFAQADVAILCLPDDAAREIVAQVEGLPVRIIDASTAHRVDEAWVYGLPELASGQRDKIRTARRVSNPGCWPTGVSLLLRPLVDEGVLPADIPLTIHGLSGYTGGGQDLISRWTDPEGGLVGLPFEAPYALNKVHKHGPEMGLYTGLRNAPVFYPAVGPFACGMRIQIPIHAALCPAGCNASAVLAAWQKRYQEEPVVRLRSEQDVVDGQQLALDPQRCNDLNVVELAVMAHPQGHLLLCAILDNLAKGASGAAVQNLNLMLGLAEFAGLRLS